MKITEVWMRNASEVEAVQITEENLYLVAEWCGGRVLRIGGGHKFIRVGVVRDNEYREAKVRPGDWLVTIADELWHFKDEDFKADFIKKTEKSLDLGKDD